MLRGANLNYSARKTEENTEKEKHNWVIPTLIMICNAEYLAPSNQKYFALIFAFKSNKMSGLILALGVCIRPVDLISWERLTITFTHSIKECIPLPTGICNKVDRLRHTVYPKKYAHGFCFAVLCCGYTLTDFPISIRLTSPALWQSNDCPSASKATLMNMDKYFMWIHYERLHNHNKAKHNKTVCIFLGIYCTWQVLLDTAAIMTRAVQQFTRVYSTWGHPYQHGINWTPAWVNNHTPSKCEMVLLFNFPIFNGDTVEDWIWTSNFISHYIVDIITYFCRE